MNIFIQTTKIDNPNLELSTDFISSLKINYTEADYNLRNEKIRPKMDCAQNEVEQFFKEKEQVQNIKFGFTTKDVDCYKANTPVAEVETDMAVYIILFDTLQLVNGNVVPFSPELGNYVPKKMLLTNPVISFFLKEFLKDLGKAIAKETFKELFPKDKDQVIREEVGKLKEDVKEFLQEIKYENLEDILLSNRVWLREDYSFYILEHNMNKEIPYKAIHKELRSRQEQLQNITTIIEARISDTDFKKCDYLTRNKFLLYTTCAVLRIIILREQLFMESILVKKGHTEYNNDAIKKILVDYNKKIQQYIEEAKDKLYKGRLDCISKDLMYYEVSVKRAAGVAGGAGYYTVQESRIKWEDSFESKKSNDPFAGDKIFSSKAYKVQDTKGDRETEVKNELSSSLKTHTEDVIRIFNDKITIPINDTIRQLEKNADVFFIEN